MLLVCSASPWFVFIAWTYDMQESTFALGERADILSELERPAMIAHMAEHEGQRLPYEVIFRNAHKLLMDTACSEALFCSDFFDGDDGAVSELLAPIVAVVEGDLAAKLQVGSS